MWEAWGPSEPPPLWLGFGVTAPGCGEGFWDTRTWVQLDLKPPLLDRMTVQLLPHTEQHCASCWGARWNGPSPPLWVERPPPPVVLWLLLAACCCAPPVELWMLIITDYYWSLLIIVDFDYC